MGLMKASMTLIAVGLLGGCMGVDSSQESSENKDSAPKAQTSKPPKDLYVGTWLRAEPGARREILTLRPDGTFSWGEILEDGREFPDGMTGVWTRKDEAVVLKISTSENCKLRKGDELKLPVALRRDGRELWSVGAKAELMFVRAPD